MIAELKQTILRALANITSQDPMPYGKMYGATQATLNKNIGEQTFRKALRELIEERLVATCNITKDNRSVDVYYTTGLVTPAVIAAMNAQQAASQPETPASTETPMQKETSASKLVQAIQRMGPICSVDLGNETGIKLSSIDGSLARFFISGEIVTRKMYAAEYGKELKHFMTKAQAESLDMGKHEAEQTADTNGDGIKQETQEPQAEHPEVTFNTQVDTSGVDIAQQSIKLAKANLELTGLREKLHQVGNDAAAYRMLLDGICRQLGVDKYEDISSKIDNLNKLLTMICEQLNISDPGEIIIEILHILSGQRTSAQQPIEQQATPAGYACLLHSNSLAIHDSEGDARQEAERMLNNGIDYPIHVVAILATAEIAVQWRKAA